METWVNPVAAILRTVFRSASVGSYFGRPRGIFYTREIINAAQAAIIFTGFRSASVGL
jgi:hypothetical protein